MELVLCIGLRFTANSNRAVHRCRAVNDNSDPSPKTADGKEENRCVANKPLQPDDYCTFSSGTHQKWDRTAAPLKQPFGEGCWRRQISHDHGVYGLLLVPVVSYTQR